MQKAKTNLQQANKNGNKPTNLNNYTHEQSNLKPQTKQSITTSQKSKQQSKNNISK